jgi:hypothetical protein
VSIVLLNTEATFTNVDEYTHKRFWFDVPDGLRKLTVKFSFSPFDDNCKGIEEVINILKKDAPYYPYSFEEAKRFLPLRNHFGVSVDTPSGWGGSVHRHNPNQCHVISEEFASNGFFPTKITAGKWGISLALNAVVTPDVNIRLSVEGE